MTKDKHDAISSADPWFSSLMITVLCPIIKNAQSFQSRVWLWLRQPQDIETEHPEWFNMILRTAVGEKPDSGLLTCQIRSDAVPLDNAFDNDFVGWFLTSES